MSRERKYQCCCDDGRDFVTFEFYSYHRANSTANYDDARREMWRLWRKTYKIIQTDLIG